MKMYAYGWKKDGDTYSVQVNDVKQGDNSELKKVFKGWKESANGWNIKNGSRLVVYNKSFCDQKEWLEWAKKCPIDLTEIKVKLGVEQRVQLNKKKRAKK